MVHNSHLLLSAGIDQRSNSVKDCSVDRSPKDRSFDASTSPTGSRYCAKNQSNCPNYQCHEFAPLCLHSTLAKTYLVR